MTARTDILLRISTGLLTSPQSVTVPRNYQRTGSQVASLDLFVDRVRDYRAIVHRVAPAEVPGLLSCLLMGQVLAPEGFPAPWLSEATAVLVRDTPPLSPQQLDQIDTVVTTCAVAIAETGTIVLNAGPGQGRRALTLVPDRHVLFVDHTQVVAAVPDAITVLDPWRPQTWISGPSATSDIELQRVEGVHGPRQLIVVLVEPTPS